MILENNEKKKAEVGRRRRERPRPPERGFSLPEAIVADDAAKATVVMYHPEGLKVIEDRLVAPDVRRVVKRGQAMVKHLGATQAASGGGEEKKRNEEKME